MAKMGTMLNCFLKVISGDEKSVNSVIPFMYVQDIYSIDYKFLKQNGITNLIFDIDNTILEVNSLEVHGKLIEFFGHLKKQKFNICIMSNNAEDRVKPVAKILKTDYMYKAEKPTRKSFRKALTILKSTKENTAMVGDQMLTDIKGANDYGVYSILVDPVKDKYDIKTGVSRLLQNLMIKKLEKKGKFKNKNYYCKERR